MKVEITGFRDSSDRWQRGRRRLEQNIIIFQEESKQRKEISFNCLFLLVDSCRC